MSMMNSQTILWNIKYFKFCYSPPASNIRYFDFGANGEKLAFDPPTLVRGRCLQHRDAASGSRAISRLESGIPA